MKPAAATLLGLLLTADCVPAGTVQETYQAALMQEKGEGRLEEAIRLYQQVVEAHEKGEGTDSLAARAKLRIGVCQEKLGLARARRTYEAVIEEYPEEAQAELEASRNLRSARSREVMLDGLSSLGLDAHPPSIDEQRIDSVSIDSMSIREQMYRELGAVKLQTQRVQRYLEAVEIDSMSVREQVYRQLEAVQLRIQQVQRRLEAFQEEIHLRGTPSFFVDASEQRYKSYADTRPKVPYAHEYVALVPMEWKFRLQVDGTYPQRQGDYSTLDYDDSDWASIRIGQAWEDQGYAGYNRGAWYRTTLTVAADSVRPVLMAFGGVDKDAFVYVNGQLVGEHHAWGSPFILDISDHVIRDGENAVAIYVYDGSHMGGVYGLINVHQPTHKVKTDGFAANRGGRVEKQYGFYARRHPQIPYSHQRVGQVPTLWRFHLDPGGLDPQRHLEYADPDYDDSKWFDIRIGQAWEDQGYDGYDQGAWYRTRIVVEAAEDRPVHLAFGGVDKDVYVYVNGQLVGQHHVRDRPFILDISKQVVRDGENTVALYVYDGADMGGVYGLIRVLQPTGEEDLDGSKKRSFWRRFF